MFEFLKKTSKVLPLMLRGLFGTNEIPVPLDQTAFLNMYTKDPWVYAAVWIISTSLARMPMWVRNQKNEIVSFDNPILDLLKQPNEDQSAFDFLVATSVYLELAGESFWEIVTDKVTKTPRELYVLRPDRVTPIASDDRRKIAGYKYTINGQEDVEFKPDQIVWIKYFNPIDDFRGQSSIQSLKSTLVDDVYGWRFAERFMKNDGRKSGYLASEKRTGEFEAKRLKEQWGDRSEKDKERTPVLPAGMDFKEIGTPPKEGGLIELLKLLRESKIAPMGVPPVLLGLLEYSKYSNYDLQLRAFHLLTLEPKLIQIEGAVNRRLMPRFQKNGALEWKFEFDKRMAGFIDVQSFVKVLWELFEKATLTPNEIIKLTGLGKAYEDGGDEHYLGERVHPAADADEEPGEAPEETPEEEPEEELDESDEVMEEEPDADAQ